MKKSLIAILILGIILVAGGVYFFIQQTPQTNGNVCTLEAKICPDGSSVGRNPANNCEFDSCPVSSNESSSTPKTYNIEIKGFAFLPSTLTIKTGDTVIWTNQDVSHTVTSDSGNELNSETLSKGGTYSHTFETSGTFNYHCSIHSSMKGEIIVN